MGKQASVVLDVIGNKLASAFTDAETKEFDRLMSKLAHSIATPTTISTLL